MLSKLRRLVLFALAMVVMVSLVLASALLLRDPQLRPIFIVVVGLVSFLTGGVGLVVAMRRGLLVEMGLGIMVTTIGVVCLLMARPWLLLGVKTRPTDSILTPAAASPAPRLPPGTLRQGRRDEGKMTLLTVGPPRLIEPAAVRGRDQSILLGLGPGLRHDASCAGVASPHRQRDRREARTVESGALSFADTSSAPNLGEYRRAEHESDRLHLAQERHIARVVQDVPVHAVEDAQRDLRPEDDDHNPPLAEVATEQDEQEAERDRPLRRLVPAFHDEEAEPSLQKVDHLRRLLLQQLQSVPDAPPP
jgi:hypothetical protein